MDPFPHQPSSNDQVIRFENVSLTFGNHKVIDDLSFHVTRGETKVIFGVAGSGKSVLLKLTAGLIKPEAGGIFVLEDEISAKSERELLALRRKIGMVFQESALFDSLTVEENVAYRLKEEHTPAEECRRRVTEALRFVELEHTLEKYPSQLSGGMRRRVAIARAIISHPEIILYDSPTGGLDPVTSTTIVELLIKQRDVYHTTALLVTHRLQDAFTMATHRFNSQTNQVERIQEGPVDAHTTFLILKDGKSIFDGNASELSRAREEDAYIRRYIS